MIKESNAYKYCEFCLENNNELVGKYVKKQVEQWKDIADGNNEEAYIDENMYEVICELLKLMIHPDLGCTIYDGMERYQWFFVVATLCTINKADNSRYYESSLLEISRKNYKTFISGVIFIIEMLIEPRFSRFFSVAPDYSLSNELRLAIKKIIKSSPNIESRFKINRDAIVCNINDSVYTPLAYSNDRMDGKMANCFLADEIGAMDDYPVEAMRSSQISLIDKLGILISTQYPNYNNVLITEVDFAKKVLDGLSEDRRYFSLLYEPDEEIIKQWEKNDLVIYQSNPVAVDNEKMFKAIAKKRAMAKLYESKRENYLCKHNNIQYMGLGVDGYVNSEQIKACEVDEWDWKGKDVFIGMDGAETSDNSSIVMIGYDEEIGKVHSKAWAFVQDDYIEEKTLRERFDYRSSIENENAIICGDSVIDYKQFEDFIGRLPEKYGVNIVDIGFDIRNLRNSAQRLRNDYGLSTVEVKQHSSVLHPTIKWLKELILKKDFCYSDNLIYQHNFVNCRCVEDTNLNKYIHKKISVKTAGKVDMVFATLNALYLLQQDLFNDNNWGVQR